MENSEKIEPSVELGDEANVEPVPGGDFLAEAVAALEAEEAVIEEEEEVLEEVAPEASVLAAFGMSGML